MLRQLRSEKFKKGLMIGILAIIIPSFMVFYGWQSSEGPQGDFGPAAELKLDKLGKVEVTQYDLRIARKLLSRRYEQYAQENGIKLEPGDLEDLLTPDNVVNEAVNVKLLEEYGAKHGIVVSDAEVEKYIENTYPAQIRPQMPQLLAQQGLSVEQFIAETKFDLLLFKIREVLSAQTRVPYYEAWLDYALKNEKLTADLVRFPVSNYLPKVQVDDAQLAAYFEKNKEKFAQPDQFEYDYIMVSRNDLRSSVTVTDDDITSYYAAHQEDYRLPRSVKARHIFLEKPADDAATTATDGGTTGAEAVRAKANEIYNRAAKGEDFAALADQFTEEKIFPHRQDEGTTAADANTTAGGNLGYILETTAKAYYGDEWTSTVFGLQAGNISSPFETRRGFHIVKVEDRREGVVQPLSDVRDMVRDRIISEKVTPLFQQMGEELRANAAKYTGLSSLAEATTLTVRTTPKVERDVQIIPGIGRLSSGRPGENAVDFGEAIRALQKGGRTDVLSDVNRHLVVEMKEEFPAHTPTLDEVRDKVTEAYRQEKANELARADAEALKAKAKDLASMQTVTAEMGTTVTTTNPFTRQEAAMVVGQSETFGKDSHNAKKGDILVTALGMPDQPQGYVVWHLTDKKEPDQTGFRKELPAISQAIARDKAEVLINEFLRDRRKQMGDRIEISEAFR